MASVEPMLNMDILEEVQLLNLHTLQKTHHGTHPPNVHVADMLKKVQDVESKLSSLTSQNWIYYLFKKISPLN